MKIEDLIDYLEDGDHDGTAYFRNPDYVDAIVGITDNNELVYSYDKMIDSLMAENDWSYDDARDWVEYNTLPTIPYMGDNKPIIIYNLPL